MTLRRGLTGDVSGVYAILYAGFRLISELLTDLAIGILVIYTDPIIALFLLGIGLFLLLFSTFLSKNRMRELGKQYRWCDIRVKAAAYQAFEGIKDVLVMHKQSVFVNRYETWTKKMQRTGVVQNVTSESPIYIFEAVLVAGLMTAIGIRAGMGAADTVFVTKLATIAMAAFRIMPSLGRIANYMNNVMFNVPSLNSCYDKVREVEQNDLKPSAESVEGLVSATPFRNDICLNHVTFRYEGTDVDILKDLNLMIRKGEAIGIIGESGAGKSTVSNLLLGLLRPQKGSVTMDGIDIRSIPEQWCRTIGYVPQSVYILDESIRTNVAFGVDEKDIDDEKVWAALEDAQMKDYVKGLPDGLDTELGERGTRFSGGQRQRIAIARALYYNPEILVLDEATSALDNQTEEAVMQAIDHLSGKKTLIIVAHRLTTIRKCDKIYEIRDGKAFPRGKGDVLG